MNPYKLTLSFITPDYTSEEHCEHYPSFQDAIDDADDLAFSTVGYPLEDWSAIDFGDGNHLYSFFPNEADTTSRYKLAILKEDI